jgi:hypothetical protein
LFDRLRAQVGIELSDKRMATRARWLRPAQWDWWAVGLVGVCVALRWWLVFAGGQYWFPDEKRFWWSGVVVYRLSQGLWKPALEPILNWNQHPGFTCLGCGLVAIHWLWAALTGLSIGQMPFEATVRFGAALLSLASVISVVLIGTIVRRAGGGRTEALLAMALMAGSNTMFYYSRHMLPYDASLALALGSLSVGMREGGWPRLVFSGWLVGAAFFTYYGYWVFVFVISGTVIMWKVASIREACHRLLWFGIGSTTWLGVFAVGRAVVFGQSFLQGVVSFAAITPPQMYAEGWSAPWTYLWYAEHGLLVFWLAALVGMLRMARTKRPEVAYALTWIAMLSAAYSLLVLSSVVLHRFVVYGRTARQLVPFLCLIGAFTGARFWEMAQTVVGKRILQLGMILLILQAAWNFHVPLQQWFPRDVRRLVAREYGVVPEVTTIDCSKMEDEFAPSGVVAQPTRYVLVNAQYLARIHGVKTLPLGVTVLRFAHPMQFTPYQYEEFTPSERDLIRRTDISMRLVDTAGERGLANPATIP